METTSADHPIRYDMMHIPEQFNLDIENPFAVHNIMLIVNEMMPSEPWEKIKIATAKVAKE